MDYRIVGEVLNSSLKQYNFQVSPKAPAGKPGKNDKRMREFRLQLINKLSEPSPQFNQSLKNILIRSLGAQNITFNQVSPNSSKFSSYTFTINNQMYDIVIARGANKGENFEVVTTAELAKAFETRDGSTDFHHLIKLLNDANQEFRQVEVSAVTQRKGSTKKTGIPVEKLGEVIGDIILKDENGKNWFVSLKDKNGVTFSAYPGAASLFNSAGELQYKSDGAKFLQSFGVDLSLVQAGFRERRGGPAVAHNSPISKPDAMKIKDIFEHAWGMNYFYVRKQTMGWEVFWIDRAKLNKLTSNIRIESITYPSKKTKSIMILCSNNEKRYKIEVRNSAGGEYPNDIKFGLR